MKENEGRYRGMKLGGKMRKDEGNERRKRGDGRDEKGKKTVSESGNTTRREGWGGDAGAGVV